MSGFRVEYGPVRAADLPAYLAKGGATAEMRRVRFGLLDRMVLIPVELVGIAAPTIASVVVLLALSRTLAATGVVVSVLAGVVVFPILLPWLPTRDFSTKGLLLGIASALPFAVTAVAAPPGSSSLLRVAIALGYLLPLPAITAYLALNFTGATPITSRSAVRREIFRYIPVLAAMFASGVLLHLLWLVRLHQGLG
jgi:hypothetical protein